VYRACSIGSRQAGHVVLDNVSTTKTYVACSIGVKTACVWLDILGNTKDILCVQHRGLTKCAHFA